MALYVLACLLKVLRTEGKATDNSVRESREKEGLGWGKIESKWRHKSKS
jgi:hypothetical protein